MKSGPIQSQSCTFELTNVSYSYSAGKISCYDLSKSTNALAINGKNATLSLSFTSAGKSKPSGKDDVLSIGISVAVILVLGVVVFLFFFRMKK